MTPILVDPPREQPVQIDAYISPAALAPHARREKFGKMFGFAVLAGVVIALIVHLICNVLGIGIASMAPGTAAASTVSPLSAGIVVRVVVSGILAAFVGTYIARMRASH